MLFEVRTINQNLGFTLRKCSITEVSGRQFEMARVFNCERRKTSAKEEVEADTIIANFLYNEETTAGETKFQSRFRRVIAEWVDASSVDVVYKTYVVLLFAV